MIYPTVYIYIYIYIYIYREREREREGGLKVGIQYIGNYCIPTFGPPCVYVDTND